MVNIRTVPFILFLISASRAEVNVTSRCSNSSETSLTFEPSEDNVKGRYKVEWCLQANKNVTKWELTLKYNDHIEQSKCQNNASDHIGTMHSYFQEPNITISLNCEQVCLSTVLDLMFNACYLVDTKLYIININSIVSSNKSDVFYIANNFTKEYFNSIPSTFEPLYEDGKLVIKWFLGNVPATDISMGIYEDNYNNDLRSYEVTHTVSGVQRDVVTSWAVVPPRCYRASLKHYAPWTSCAFFERIVHIEDKFCLRAPGVAEASSSPEGALRVLAGVTAAAVVIALVLLAVWRHRPLSWQRRVRDHWLKAARSPPPQHPCVDGAILLLYARDCASFVRVAERLAVLVRSAIGCQVIDVYNGESMRLWAPAGDEWLRLLMSREDTRVLLLQSPAGALLAAELSDTRAGPALSAPLLGSRVMWRRPHAGDSLLSMALRLMSAAPSPSPYRKYYVAGISGLGAEMATGVTPQRRYTLPEAVLCLLRDLAPGLNRAPGLDLAPGCDLTSGLNSAPGLDSAPGLEHTELEPLLRQFKEVADAFADHVREHPDCLADELLFN